jgi:hypothetical protein
MTYDTLFVRPSGEGGCVVTFAIHLAPRWQPLVSTNSTNLSSLNIGDEPVHKTKNQPPLTVNFFGDTATTASGARAAASLALLVLALFVLCLKVIMLLAEEY